MKLNINPIVLLKGVFFTLAITFSSFQGITGDKPEKDENNLSFCNTQHKETPSPSQLKKTASYEFEPFSRKTKLTLPGLNVSFPFLKPLFSGTSGILSFTTLPLPLNFMIGLPLMGLGAGAHFIPQCKTTWGKMLLGTSIAGITIFATTTTTVFGFLVYLAGELDPPFNRFFLHSRYRFLVTCGLLYIGHLHCNAKCNFEPVFVPHENESE